jgi:DNA-binding response OmpR family regulator
LVIAVEDDPDEAFLLQRAFRKAGSAAKLEILRDGEQALARLTAPGATMPHMVLLDLKLPRLSGFEVLRVLREELRTRSLPVLVLTASGDPEDVAKAYDLGATAYLVKPTHLSDFTALIAAANSFWLQFNVR